MIVLQNVSEVNRERSLLTAASRLYDSTKHNGLVTKVLFNFSMDGGNVYLFNGRWLCLADLVPVRLPLGGVVEPRHKVDVRIEVVGNFKLLAFYKTH